MRRSIIYFLISLSFLSCDKYSYENKISIIILDEPITKITTKPNKIDPSKYEFIMDTFVQKKLSGDPYYNPSFEIEMLEVPDDYGGLEPRYKMAILLSPLYLYSDTNENYAYCECLVRDGALGAHCKNMVIFDSRKYIFIESINTFQEIFQPIESEEEALSYVAIATGSEIRYSFDIQKNFLFFVDTINKSYAQEVDGGFNTMTFFYDYFGCEPHYHYCLRHFVDYEGNITRIEEVEIYENPADIFCAD